MTYAGVTISDPTEVLNAFANFFQSSYVNSTSSEHCDSEQNPYVATTTCLPIPVVTEQDVLIALKMIKPKNTRGIDGIPAFIVRDCAAVFAKPLSVIFNFALKTATYPDRWKISRVVPIFKKGDKCNIENYRPISIICNFSKVFEIVLKNVIYSHFQSQIISNQHGFVSGRSTTSNLVCMTQFVAEILDTGGQVDVVYTDFSKAFDKLDHHILINKLSLIGLSDIFLKFFESYLSGRSLNVQYRGFNSTDIVATSGVPQGSVLGPLLFIIFINDIVIDLQCKTLLYADDLKIFLNINSIDDCCKIQNDLLRLDQWCKTNKLNLNISKCNVMTYTRKRVAIRYEYELNDVLINRCSSFKDLGVLFDSTLSFAAHITEIVAAAFRNLGFIMRHGKDFGDVSTLSQLFNAFVRSKLEYSSIVWSPGYDYYKTELEKPLRRFAKYIWFKTDGVYPHQGYPNEELLRRLNVHNLSCRREYHSLLFLFKLLNNITDCPELLEKICFCIPNSLTRSYSSTFYFPTTRTNLLRFSPLHKMCSVYDSVSHCLDIFSCKQVDIKRCILR